MRMDIVQDDGEGCGNILEFAEQSVGAQSSRLDAFDSGQYVLQK